MPLNVVNLPDSFNPKDFNPKKYDRLFRNDSSIRLSNEMIRYPLLGYAIKNSLSAATSLESLTYRLTEKGKEMLRGPIGDKLTRCLFKSFLKIQPGLTAEAYQKWHRRLCRRLIKICNGLERQENELGWTYGNSRKAVNLIVKYLVIIAKAAKKIGVVNKVTKIGEAFLAIKKHLDIPVDSCIIEASKNYNKAKGNKPLALPIEAKERDGKPSYRKVKAWSKWSEDDYNKYSGSLHKSFEHTKHPPLDWEGRAWTEVKKTREKKNIDGQGL